MKEEDTKRGVLNHAGEYYAFENDDNIQYNTAVINDAISIFEHQQEINNIEDYDPNVKYRYAVYLSEEDWDEYEDGYEFTKRGATLGRIFTTGNNFNNFHNFSDAGKVIRRYKEILEENGESTDDKDIITLYELELDNEQFLDETAVVNAIENEENLNFDNDVKPLVNR